jgi:DNA-binding NtrC family response regulator
MRQLLRRLDQLAGLATPVLITGEPGTGKHLLAHALHQRSQRSGPLLSVNALGLAAEELFLHLYGQERLRRDGGRDITPGLLERAHGGTLLFEEVAQLDAGGQRCLRQLLGEPTYARRGSTQLRRAAVRVIAMTSEPLLERVRRGTFNETLFHHLTPAWLDVPPLRQRRDDIPRLAAAFLAHDQPPDLRGPIELPAATLLRLLGYGWPGNVRELRELLRQAALPVRPTRSSQRPELDPDIVDQLLAGTGIAREVRFKLGTPLETVQREIILMTLAAVDGNKKDAAALLGLSRGALYSRLRTYGAQARDLWSTAQQRPLASLTAEISAPSPKPRRRRKSDSPPGNPAVETIREPAAHQRPDAQVQEPARNQDPKAQGRAGSRS